MCVSFSLTFHLPEFLFIAQDASALASLFPPFFSLDKVAGMEPRGVLLSLLENGEGVRGRDALFAPAPGPGLPEGSVHTLLRPLQRASVEHRAKSHAETEALALHLWVGELLDHHFLLFDGRPPAIKPFTWSRCIFCHGSS